LGDFRFAAALLVLLVIGSCMTGFLGLFDGTTDGCNVEADSNAHPTRPSYIPTDAVQVATERHVLSLLNGKDWN
jgi:hypothetical protein